MAEDLVISKQRIAQIDSSQLIAMDMHANSLTPTSVAYIFSPKMMFSLHCTLFAKVASDISN